MNDQQFSEWLQKHGGEQNRTSGQVPGQTIVFANDGSRIVLTRLTPDTYRVDDVFEKDDPAANPVPAPSDQPPATGGAAAPAPTSGKMTRAQLEALVGNAPAGGGTWEFNQGTRDKQVTEYGITKTVKVPYVQWINRATGQTIEAEVDAGGDSYTVVTNSTVPGNKTKPNSEGQTVPTNTTEPFIVTRMPDGSLKSEPNPNYQGNKPKDPQVTTFDGNLVRVHPDGRTEIIMRGVPDAKTAVIEGQLWERGQDGSWKPVAGDKKPDRVDGPDGIKYEKGPDGVYRPLQGIPTPGEVSARGPQMPQIVKGAASQAMTDYWNQLQSDPSIPPAEKERRFQQFVQVASTAVQQAATEQRDAESQRNDQYNRSLAQLNFQQNSTQNAMAFIEKFSGQLKPGSNAGADAFAAMMGLQMIQMRLSGIANPPAAQAPAAPATGGSGRALPPPLLTGPQPPAAYPGAPAPQNAGAGAGEPPSRGAAAANVAPPAPRPAPAPAAAAAPQSAAGNERPDDIITITIPSGRQEKVTRTEYEAGLAQGLWRKEWVTNAESGSAAPANPYNPPSTSVTSGTGIAPNPGAPSTTVTSGTGIVPYVPPQGGNVQQQNVPDFAVLAGRPQQQPMAQGGVPTGVYDGGGDYAVLGPQQQQPMDLHQEAAAAIPWRIDEATWRRYKAAGIPDEVIAGVM